MNQYKKQYNTNIKNLMNYHTLLQNIEGILIIIFKEETAD